MPSPFRESNVSDALRNFPAPIMDEPLSASASTSVAILAGGCFWCTEAVFAELQGVQAVTPGYSGGEAEAATYEKVCSGRTGHAEVIRVVYEQSQISFGALLKVFFAVAHDPTQYHRQGNDVGPQYRSAIFALNPLQQEIAAAYIAQLDAAQVFRDPIVTRIEPAADFFSAEPYHQNYAALHPGQPYIQAMAAPKVEKLRAYFSTQHPQKT